MEKKGLRVNAGKTKIVICRVQASIHAPSVALERAATASSAIAASSGCTRNAAGGGSFILLPRRHAVSSRWL